MKSFFKNIVLNIFLLLTVVQADSLIFDVYIFRPDVSSRESFQVSKEMLEMREYPLATNITISPAWISDCEDEIKMVESMTGLKLQDHFAWTTPSFSKRINLSLKRSISTLHENKDPDLFADTFFQLQDEYYRPSIFRREWNSFRTIGNLELSYLNRQSVHCSLKISDFDCQLVLKDTLPIESWIILDRNHEVILIYISKTKGRA